MIIETAFLKLPELLISSGQNGDIFEATIVHFMSLALNMELNSRNIPKPYEHVLTEKPYLSSVKDRRLLQADLFLKLEGIYSNNTRNFQYGIRNYCWLEVKAYLGGIRHKSTEPKTSHAGKIIRDILRLSILPEELQGSHRDNSRYFLQVFSDLPLKYIAFSDKTNRAWIEKLFVDGISEFEIDLTNEAKSFKKSIGAKFENIKNLRIRLKTKTLSFGPDQTDIHPIFYGYLNRILEYTIELDDLTLSVNNGYDDYWDLKKIESHDNIRSKLLEYL